MERTQLNVRLDSSLVERIDQKRIELREQVGSIPTRSDVLRMALEAFLTSDPISAREIKKTRTK